MTSSVCHTSLRVGNSTVGDSRDVVYENQACLIKLWIWPSRRNPDLYAVLFLTVQKYKFHKILKIYYTNVDHWSQEVLNFLTWLCYLLELCIWHQKGKSHLMWGKYALGSSYQFSMSSEQISRTSLWPSSKEKFVVASSRQKTRLGQFPWCSNML